MKDRGFETTSVRMERLLLVSVFAPEDDIERILEQVRAIDPLAQGDKYDSNAFQAAAGTERYRPLNGAAAGPETDVRKRPGVTELSFELADDQALLERVVEAVFQVHSYQEPVIRVRHVLTSRSKGLDDRDNPHRWWNTTGDWKSRPKP